MQISPDEPFCAHCANRHPDYDPDEVEVVPLGTR
jgi:hypothetical protein